MGRNYYFGVLILLIIVSCKVNYNNEPVQDTIIDSTNKTISTDFLLYEDSYNLVWLSHIQYSNILLSDISNIDIPKGYSLLTKEEAKEYRMIDIPNNTGQRYLCISDSIWYTFKWNEGTITKAGSKTKYTLCFIKKEIRDTDSIISNDITYYIYELN